MTFSMVKELEGAIWQKSGDTLRFLPEWTVLFHLANSRSKQVCFFTHSIQLGMGSLIYKEKDLEFGSEVFILSPGRSISRLASISHLCLVQLLPMQAQWCDVG